MNPSKLAGLLFFLAGSVVLMGIITAEALYPALYTTAQSEISDLGSTKPPESVILQPSASIFNVTMLVSGLLSLTATHYLHRFSRRLTASIPLGLFGLGLVGVGIFPGNLSPMHGIFSLLAFTSGGASAILTFGIVSTPLRYVGIVFGAISLVTIFTAKFMIPYIGDGGAERWVAYPILLWLTGFGGYLMNQSPGPVADGRASRSPVAS